jgi:hypothetical protein
MTRCLVGAVLAFSAVMVGPVGAQELKSGLPIGSGLPAPLEVLNINGRFAGTKKEVTHCMFSSNPYLLIFARSPGDTLTDLVKKIEVAATTHRDARLGAVVVFCSQEAGLDKKLTELAEKQNLERVVLSIYPSADGPPKHLIAKEAEVTVVGFNRGKVRISHAFRPGDLTGQAITRVLADIPKLIEGP